ncbi:polysaccharide biosynthesis/export family protein [Jiella avicenniae]|uniref:Polysaccharide export protein n=1 Tax=Jiella avicenniae TaxID=2907202 RepID=A0A9X1P4K6_9HYPH|nr:polysaccharide biosynthesis/export family protein [Jiella avicenniae]MCE7029163.1 polysaccharide export protein [Jiella avicenniae]
MATTQVNPSADAFGGMAGRAGPHRRGGAGLVLAVLAAGLLSGCAALPSAGPTAGAFVGNVDEKAVQWRDGYLLVPVDDTVLAYQHEEPRPSFRGIASRSLPSDTGIGVGDVVQVTLFEAGVGGLFSSLNAGGQGSSSVHLPEQQVARDGSITIPYAGRVRVAGSTASAVEQRIVAALRDRAIEPQAVVAVSQGNSTAVTVTGDAVQGASVPIPASGLKILDLIARVGGPKTPIYETAVSLTRGGRTVQMPFSELVNDPTEDVYVRPGDVVLLTRQPRTYVALGATGKSDQLPLQGYEMSLAEALAQVGGLNPTLANPKGVFVLRREPGAEMVARYEGQAFTRAAPGEDATRLAGEIPVIYRFDLRQPSGLLHAQDFRIHDGDMLYVATAPFVPVKQALDALSGVVTPALTAVNTASIIENRLNR